MHSCDEIRIELKAFVDGELASNQRAAVERHIQECSECRSDVAEISRISSQLQTLDTATPRPELRSRILAQVIPSSLPETRKSTRPFWRTWLPGVALAGAAAGAAVIIGFVSYKGS